jgi:uncharacterized membrane protein
MSDLVVISYPDTETAIAARTALYGLATQHLVELEDAVVVTKDSSGKVQLHQSMNLTAEGAWSGAFWGSIVGWLFLAPILGAAIGAGTGALGGYLTDLGVDDDFARQVGASLPPGGSALLVLFRKVTADKVLPELGHFGGTVLQTSWSAEQDAKLRAALAQHGNATYSSPASDTSVSPPVGDTL